MRAALLIPLLLLAACTPRDKAEVRRDSKEFEENVKKGYKKADRAVTKALQDAKTHVQEGARDLKRNTDRPKEERP